MKEITAIIRMNKIQQTKRALLDAGFPSLTVQKVLGRGRQKGLRYEFSPPLSKTENNGATSAGPKFIAKRMLTILVDDESAREVVDIIIKTNQTGHFGDGKIFVSPVAEVKRIRTGERGVRALF